MNILLGIVLVIALAAIVFFQYREQVARHRHRLHMSDASSTSYFPNASGVIQ